MASSSSPRDDRMARLRFLMARRAQAAAVNLGVGSGLTLRRARMESEKPCEGAGSGGNLVVGQAMQGWRRRRVVGKQGLERQVPTLFKGLNCTVAW